MVTKKIKHKKEDGTVVEVDIGCEAYHVAQDAAHRFFSDVERAKLEDIEEYANHYILPAATSTTLGGIKIGSNLNNQDGKVSLTKENVTNALGYIPPKTNTTYEEASDSKAGLMSAADKAKVDAMDKTIDTRVKNHNESVTAHTDIRELISGLTRRFNALADSDDNTLDQLSEIVAYIKSNKNLIDGITTSKVNVSDIVDDVSSSSINKPLSARQGKVLRDLITSLTDIVATKVEKVSGKGLSTNDYTTAEKNKLKEIAEGANNYSLPAATSTTLGGIKVGDNITNENGEVSLTKENVVAALGYTPPEKDTNTTQEWISNNNIGTGFQTGKQTAYIAPDAIDICIKVNFTKDIVGTIFIPTAFLTSEGQHFRTGYFQNEGNGGVASFLCTHSQITLEHVFLNSEEITDSINWVLWSR